MLSPGFVSHHLSTRVADFHAGSARSPSTVMPPEARVGRVASTRAAKTAIVVRIAAIDDCAGERFVGRISSVHSSRLLVVRFTPPWRPTNQELRPLEMRPTNLSPAPSSIAAMRTTLAVLAALFAAALPLRAADDPGAHPTIEIARASGGITVDGDLAESAWKSATRVDKWWETNPGDNIEPKVKSVGYLMYDDKFFYAGFEFEDPTPSKISSPFNDRDHINGSTDDYGGVILDTRHDHKTAILFLATARGIQYDAVSDDSTGNEDSSPDFFWDSAAKINDHGWTLEIRIPLSSLRYDQRDPQEWGIMLYRNWPRDFRYQMFANKLPRGGNCFICNENTLAGLRGLPPAGHMIVAPYATAKEIGETRDGLGTPFVNRPIGSNGGADLKWTPTPTSAVDATVNPDFSQIESDVAV